MRKDDWISGMYHGYNEYLYKMIQLKPILEQVRGASQVAGTEDDTDLKGELACAGGSCEIV